MWTTPEKSAVGLKAAGDQSHGAHWVPQPFSLDDGITPHLSLEQGVFGKHQDPLRDCGWVGVERDADVARWSLACHA